MENADINEMEKYIREGLPSVLESIEKSKGVKLLQIEKSFIFGVKYALNETNFMLLPGEKITIKDIANHVKSKLAANSNHFALDAVSRSRKFNPNNTVNTIIGLIYGDGVAWSKPRKKFETCSEKSVGELKQKLLKTISDLYKQEEFENSVEDEFDSMIDVDCRDLANIKGIVKCKLCSKTYSVFCKRS